MSDCCTPLPHDHGDCDGYVFTVRDFWTGLYLAAENESHLRSLFTHGPYKDHCGGYEVHAWPCVEAADVLSDLRAQVGAEAWGRVDFFTERP